MYAYMYMIYTVFQSVENAANCRMLIVTNTDDRCLVRPSCHRSRYQDHRRTTMEYSDCVLDTELILVDTTTLTSHINHSLLDTSIIVQ